MEKKNSDIGLTKKSKLLIKKLQEVLLQIEPPLTETEVVNRFIEKCAEDYTLNLAHKIKFDILKYKLKYEVSKDNDD